MASWRWSSASSLCPCPRSMLARTVNALTRRVGATSRVPRRGGSRGGSLWPSRTRRGRRAPRQAGLRPSRRADGTLQTSPRSLDLIQGLPRRAFRERNEADAVSDPRRVEGAEADPTRLELVRGGAGTREVPSGHTEKGESPQTHGQTELVVRRARYATASSTGGSADSTSPSCAPVRPRITFAQFPKCARGVGPARSRSSNTRASARRPTNAMYWASPHSIE